MRFGYRLMKHFSPGETAGQAVDDAVRLLKSHRAGACEGWPEDAKAAVQAIGIEVEAKQRGELWIACAKDVSAPDVFAYYCQHPEQEEPK